MRRTGGEWRCRTVGVQAGRGRWIVAPAICPTSFVSMEEEISVISRGQKQSGRIEERSICQGNQGRPPRGDVRAGPARRTIEAEETARALGGDELVGKGSRRVVGRLEPSQRVEMEGREGRRAGLEKALGRSVASSPLISKSEGW